jgi:hypothetical protein
VDTSKNDITGRDGYIIAQALATAIHYLEKMPELYRPESNIADMRRLLAAYGPQDGKRFLDELRRD